MFTEEEIKEYKELIAQRNELAKNINEHIITGKEKEKQILSELAEFGYSSLSDVKKLEEEAIKLEESLRTQKTELLEEIKTFSQQDEELQQAMLG